MENRISPESSLWNPWHGCHKLSTGCRHCYVYRGDSKHGKDSSIITKTGQFNLPVRRKKDKTYKIPSGNLVYTCFTSDFLIEEADEWRIEAWKMMRERYDLHFLFITKRIDRLSQCLPPDWGDGYDNVTICCTMENQERVDYRLPLYKAAPVKQKTYYMNTDDRKWEIIESEYLIRRPWLTARRDRVKLPTGVEIPEYYILEYPDWVNVIAITKEGKFVLVRQYRHGIKETRYEICAGVCETGEEPLLSAQRELYEETGYGNGNWTKLMTVSANASTMTNITHCYLATEVERISTQHLEETEDLTVHLLSEEEIKALLLNDEVKQSLMAAPLWKYFALYSHS